MITFLNKWRLPAILEVPCVAVRVEDALLLLLLASGSIIFAASVAFLRFMDFCYVSLLV